MLAWPRRSFRLRGRLKASMGGWRRAFLSFFDVCRIGKSFVNTVGRLFSEGW